MYKHTRIWIYICIRMYIYIHIYIYICTKTCIHLYRSSYVPPCGSRKSRANDTHTNNGMRTRPLHVCDTQHTHTRHFAYAKSITCANNVCECCVQISCANVVSEWLYTRKYTPTHIHVQTHILNRFTYIYLYAYTHVYMHKYMHIYISMRVYIFTCVRGCIYKHTHIYIYICVQCAIAHGTRIAHEIFLYGTREYIYIFVCMYLHENSFIHTYKHVCIWGGNGQ